MSSRICCFYLNFPQSLLFRIFFLAVYLKHMYKSECQKDFHINCGIYYPYFSYLIFIGSGERKMIPPPTPKKFSYSKSLHFCCNGMCCLCLVLSKGFLFNPFHLTIYVTITSLLPFCLIWFIIWNRHQH